MITDRFAHGVAFVLACLTIRPMSRRELMVRAEIQEEAVKNQLAYCTQMGYVSSSDSPDGPVYMLTSSGQEWLDAWREQGAGNCFIEPARPKKQRDSKSNPIPITDRILSVLTSDPKKGFSVEEICDILEESESKVYAALGRLKLKGQVLRVDANALRGIMRGSPDGRRSKARWSVV